MKHPLVEFGGSPQQKGSPPKALRENFGEGPPLWLRDSGGEGTDGQQTGEPSRGYENYFLQKPLMKATSPLIWGSLKAPSQGGMRGDRPAAAPPFLIMFKSVSSVTPFI